MFGKKRRIHMIGIGGSGMSGIAEVLLDLGHLVSGSDLKHSSVTERLAAMGAEIRIGHSAQNLGFADVVVISSAVSSDNPEVISARAKNIPVIPRAEMLAEIMRLKFSITIAGAHGKTSTTSMVGLLLHHAGLDPTIVIGGRLRQIGSNARVGRGEYAVVEADESDRSFLLLPAMIAVITNIDEEHMDSYKDLDDIKNCFVQFARKVPFYGAAILCLDDPHNREIIPRIERRIITYGFSPEADFQAVPIFLKEFGSEFQVYHHGTNIGSVQLNVPGKHSIVNSLAALGVAGELGISFDTARAALAEFHGVDRRFQLKCNVNDTLVIDDYAHHPTEIAATIRAARAGFDRRIVAIFQPHRYTRLRHLMEQFAGCFDGADVLVLTDIYPAGEKPIAGVTIEKLAQQFKDKEVILHKEIDTLPEKVMALIRPGDLVMFMGAGSITIAADRTAKLLQEKVAKE